MSNNFEHLLSPMKIGNVTIKNRVSVCPMGSGYGNQLGPHGEWTDEMVNHVLERARGGFGLFFGGCLMTDYKVDPFDLAGSMMGNKGDFIRISKMMNEKASYYDMKIIQQISFGLGRNFEGLVSPSENEVFGMPGVMSPVITTAQIRQKMDCVVEAACLMKDSGYTGVEIHAMHWGYLLDQFAMAITNHREDEYGGSLENRLRISRELVKEIKQVCGEDFIVSMRLGLKSYMSKKGLNITNYTGEDEGGRTVEEAVRIAKYLEEYGYDVLNCDIGVYDTWYYAAAPIYVPKGIILPMLERVKQAVGIPVLGCTKLNDPYMDEQAIAGNKLDGVVLGRQSLADPYYVKKLEQGCPEKIRPCIACNNGCIHNVITGGRITCAVNPAVFHEQNYGLERALVSKKVAVIGGGIAGMEAARVAKLRGHSVTIYEKDGVLGGLIIPAGAHEYKPELRQLNDWYRREIEQLGIEVVLNEEMDAEKARRLDADTVLLATGSQPVMPRIPGIDSPKCTSGVDALNGTHPVGKKVVIVGGGLVGCETAIDYAQQGKDVTIVEAAEAVLVAAKNVPLPVLKMIPDMLEYYQVKIMAGNRICAVNEEGAVVESVKDGTKSVILADTVVMSIGMRSKKNFADELRGSGKEVFVIGDANRAGTIYTSIHSAYDVAGRI